MKIIDQTLVYILKVKSIIFTFMVLANAWSKPQRGKLWIESNGDYMYRVINTGLANDTNQNCEVQHHH